MPLMNTDIKTYDMRGLQQAMKELGQPAFRAKQIYEWLWYKHVDSFDKMTNLSLALREELASKFSLATPKLIDKQESSDGTRKYVLELSDGALVETVGIPADASRERLTVCFSTQVGCPMECVFCATGHEGFTRNLTIGEIVDQVYFVEEDFGRHIKRRRYGPRGTFPQLRQRTCRAAHHERQEGPEHRCTPHCGIDVRHARRH